MTTSRSASAIPYVIIGAFVLFAAYIGMFVQRALRSRVELVSADYYQQELGYDQRLAAQARAAALPAPVQMQAGATTLSIQLPAALAGQAIGGTVHFRRPADARLDFDVPFRPTDLRQTCRTATLAAGHWRVQLDFTANGQTYFVEDSFEKQPAE